MAALDAILTTGDLATQQSLLGIVEGCCRAAGLGAVFDDDWCDDFPWVKTYRLD